MRARPHSAEEAQFLSALVAGQGIQVSYDDLEHAPTVLLAGLEPEEESPIVLLRLRKAARRGQTSVFSIAPFAARGLAKMSGVLLATAPGEEARALTRLGDAAPPRSRSSRAQEADPADQVWRDATQALAAPARSSWSASGWPRRPARCRLRPGWPRPPGPGWPGSRAGPGSAARSKPAPCPGCCRSDARSPTRTPGPRWPGPGASPRCRPSPAVTPARILAAAAAGELGALVVGRCRPGRPARPGRRAGRAGRHPVHRQPGDPGQRGHRPRRRGAPGGGGLREGRHVRQLGRPRRHVHRSAARARDPYRAVRAGRGRRRDGRAPRPA